MPFKTIYLGIDFVNLPLVHKTRFLLILLCLYAFVYEGSVLGAEPKKILIVGTEQGGIYQTGGLAHAIKGVAASLRSQGNDVSILMPYFENLPEQIRNGISDTGNSFDIGLKYKNGSPKRSVKFSIEKMDGKFWPTYFLRHKDTFFERNFFTPRGNNPYAPASIEAEAIGSFAKGAAKFIMDNNYDVVVLNDWVTGLIAPFIQMERDKGHKTPKLIFTIHNMAFQGNFSPSYMNYLGLDPSFFSAEGLEQHNLLSYLKAGIRYSDFTYTVSLNYSQELSTPLFGMGFDKIIQGEQEKFKFSGIPNGIINEEWDPTTHYGKKITHTFSPDDLSGKAMGKEIFQREMGLNVDAGTPVCELTSRVSSQKGFEYFVEAMRSVLKERNVQFVVIGHGEKFLIKAIKNLSQEFKGKVAYREFDKELEKQATAYSDFFINAAWFEPSGQNQHFAKKNGTIPILSRVGGLADSVVDGVTGFLIDIVFTDNKKEAGRLGPYNMELTKKAVHDTLLRAVDTYNENPELITQMRLKGMAEDNSWASRSDSFSSLVEFVSEDGPRRLKKLRPEGSSAGLSVERLLGTLKTEEAKSLEILSCEGALAEEAQK